jgi:hypothetical protein
VDIDLRRLFPDPSESNEALDRFVADRLYEAGIWDSPRESDGVVFVRLVEHASHAVRLAGRLYTIDQKLHAFWLDLHVVDGDVEWALHYDVVASSERRARNAIYLHDHAREIEWGTELAGRVKAHGEWLVTPLRVSSVAMPKVRVATFSVSVDGFGAAPGQSLAHPLGEGGMRLHEWLFPTRMFHEMIGKEGGATGPDDDFAKRGMENLGAWILGRNMFGPIRGPWPNDEWKGWWGSPAASTKRSRARKKPRATATSASAAARRPSVSISKRA